jgi:hypothetical protein
MRRFVFWTGVANVLAGIALQLASVSMKFIPTEATTMVPRLFGAIAFLTGAMLVLCSRDLKGRGTLVAWEGVLRLVGFVAMTGYGVLCHGGFPIALAGLLDGLIGVAYLYALPRHLGVSLASLVLDRNGTDKSPH